MDAEIRALSNDIIGEIFLALGFQKYGAAYKTLGWIFRKPAGRLSTWCVQTDRMVATDGFPQAAEWILGNWCNRVTCHGAESVPKQGPLLVISNHSGTYDTFVITSRLRRNDLNLIGSDVPFLKHLPHASEHIFFLSDKVHDRMNSARAGIRHLQSGGALLLYGTGLIDPDPEVYPDAGEWIEKWLPSADLFLRVVPETKIVLSIVSGVVAKKWAQHPLTRLMKVDWQKRRLAEFGQVLWQLFFPGRLYLQPHISFSPPFGLADLRQGSGSNSILPELIRRGKALLAEHLARIEEEHGK